MFVCVYLQHRTLETVLDRGENLDDLVGKSEELSLHSKAFYTTVVVSVHLCLCKHFVTCCLSLLALHAVMLSLSFSNSHVLFHFQLHHSLKTPTDMVDAFLLSFLTI